MLDAIKRAIIVIIGVILQFGFSILLRFFFKEHIMFVGVIYWLIGVLIVLWIIKNSTRLSNDLPFIASATDSRIIPVRSGTSNRYYHFIIKNNNPLILYKLLPVDSAPNINTRYFAISLDPENELIGEITKDNNVTTEFVCENPNIALGKFFME